MHLSVRTSCFLLAALSRDAADAEMEKPPVPERPLIMSLGPSLPLAPCSTRERQSTRAKHRSRVVVITREARGRAPRVLTAPFGLDRSPVDDEPNGHC